jgi:hypothetical protein
MTSWIYALLAIGFASLVVRGLVTRRGLIVRSAGRAAMLVAEIAAYAVAAFLSICLVLEALIAPLVGRYPIY